MADKFGTPDEKPNPILVALVSQFLSNHGFTSTVRIFANERRKRHWPDGFRPLQETFGEKFTKDIPQLDVIFKQYAQKNKKNIDVVPRSRKTGDSSSSSSSESDSSEDSESDVDVADGSRSEASHAPSSSSSSSASSSSSSSSDTSESDSDKSDVGAKPKAQSLKRKAGSSTTSSSSSDSDSDEDQSEQASRPRKKVKVKSSKSDSESSSSDSSSASTSSDEQDDEDESGVEELAAAVKASLPDSDSSESSSDSEAEEKAASESESSDGSSDSSSSSDESEDEVKGKEKVKKPVFQLVEMTEGAASDSSATIQGDAAPLPPWPTKIKTHTGARPTRLAELSENMQEGDYLSNRYVSYNYADRAYQDLSITRGKGFTKEKNKKKRGSYRGGTIDTSGGKSFKFED